MARSCPTTQARRVAPRSSRIRAATGRCFGETSARIPSRYSRGWRARYRAITTPLAPSMNSLRPAVTYGRIDPRRKFVASSMSPATRPDWGFANSVFRSTGYSRAHAAITFWMLVSVCGSPEMSACVWSMTGGTRSAPIPTTAAVLATLAAVVGIGALLVPPVIDQTQALISGLPQTLTNIQNVIAAWAREYPVLRNTELANPQSGLVAGLIDDATNFLRGSILPYVTAGGKLFIEGASVVVMALYLANRPRLYRDGILSLVSPQRRAVGARVLDDAGATLRAWVVGQLLAMTVLGVLTAIGLWALGVPYWLAFGIFTGLVAVVPFFGTLFSTLLPALFVVGTGDWLKVLAVIALGVAVHVVESNYVVPRIMERRVSLPPVLTITSVLIMGALLGVVGLVVARPVLAVARGVIRPVWHGRMYGQ